MRLYIHGRRTETPDRAVKHRHRLGSGKNTRRSKRSDPTRDIRRSSHTRNSHYTAESLDTHVSSRAIGQARDDTLRCFRLRRFTPLPPACADTRAQVRCSCILTKRAIIWLNRFELQSWMSKALYASVSHTYSKSFCWTPWLPSRVHHRTKNYRNQITWPLILFHFMRKHHSIKHFLIEQQLDVPPRRQS